MARRAGIPAVTEGLDVSALALYEPPYFAGSNGTEHLTTLARMLNAGQLDEATRDNLPRLSDGRTRPLDATWFSAGSRSSASPTARSSSAGDPNGHLDFAPDRRLADLELSGADRAALAPCAEFGQ
jgi:hypothetical protein